MALPFPIPDPSVSASDCILPQAEITFLYNSTNLSQYVTDVKISGSRGAAVTGSVTLKDRTGYLADFVSDFNQTHSAYRSHNMTDTRTVSLTLKQGSRFITYPNLIPGAPNWDNEATLTWEFSDYTPLLDVDNQNIGEYLYFEGTDASAYDAIGDISTAAGKTITPDFSDYDLGSFRANETNYYSALDELQQPRQAYRKWVADVLHLETLTESGSVMHIVDRLHIPREGGLTGGIDDSRLRTYFKFTRDKPLATSLGENQCTGNIGEESQCVGRVVQIQFNRPTIHARIHILSVNRGSIEDGVFYDAADNPLSGIDDWFIYYGTSSALASYWVGTYYPEFIVGTDMYAPGWRVRATGGTIVPEASGDFTIQNTLTALEAIYGHRPEYKDMETELLRDPATATAMLEAIETEINWSLRVWNLNTPILVPGREGEMLTLTHKKHGFTAEPMLINSFSHSYSIASGFSNSYELRAEV